MDSRESTLPMMPREQILFKLAFQNSSSSQSNCVEACILLSHDLLYRSHHQDTILSGGQISTSKLLVLLQALADKSSGSFLAICLIKIIETSQIKLPEHLY